MANYQYPFKKPYRLGSLYGKKGSMWKAGWHSGVDFFSKDVGGDGRTYPVCEGVVIGVNVYGASYGNDVAIKHPDGYISLYAHLASVAVKVGQAVGLDTILGIEGTTGNSTAVHLHLEVHKGAYHYPAGIDPLKFLEERIDIMIIYKTLSDIPAWGRTVVQRLVGRGSLQGDEKGDLNISLDFLRTLVVLDREGVIK